MAQRVEARRPEAVNPRPKRAREEELLVWPDLVFVEFISAVLFLVTLTFLSAAINGPLLDKADSNVTPNPAKAPWYFLNLQELLLHMDPALAGVVVPTVALIGLAAIPYFDRSHEGQGVWFGTPDAKRITWFAAVFAGSITILLVLFSSGKHVTLYERLGGSQQVQTLTPQGQPQLDASGRPVMQTVPRNPWPTELNGLRSLSSINTAINWPSWTRDIPYLPFNLEVRGQEFRTLDFPLFLVSQGIPVATMLGLPVVMVLIQKRWIGRLTKHDAMVSVFTGFITVFVVLTVIGTAFRGESLELVYPWEVKTPED